MLAGQLGRVLTTLAKGTMTSCRNLQATQGSGQGRGIGRAGQGQGRALTRLWTVDADTTPIPMRYNYGARTRND